MALSNFLSKLNWRLILVHFIACWFFYHALWQLGFLYDYDFFELIVHHKYKDIDALSKYSNDHMTIGYRLARISINAALIGLIGLLIGFVVSLFLSLKNRWYWVNSLIVLLITFTVCLFNRFYWHHIKVIFQAPGRIFQSDWAFILTNGLIILAIGICLFFLKRIIRFIDGKKLNPVALKIEE
jgi:hypothetical protein